MILLPEIVLPLTVRDLTAADLPACRWSGGRSHLAAIAGQLDRAARGESEYLTVCPPSGLPVALGGIDYVKIPGAGVLWQLAVHGMLQSYGIGTILIQAAEQRIRAVDLVTRPGRAPISRLTRLHARPCPTNLG